MECSKCGTELDFREAFCSKCGKITDRGKGPGELAGRYAAELADGLGKLIATAFAYVTNPENRKNVGIGAVIALVLIMSLATNPISSGIGSMFERSPDAPTFNDDGTPNLADYEDFFLAEEEEYLVTGIANIRDFPTSDSTTVIGTIEGGETVFAREVRGFDASSQWFKLASGGYVWGGNLAGNAQPAPEVQLRFPASLVGRWSNHAECTGSGRDMEIVVSTSSVTIRRTRYDLTNILGAGNEVPGYELAQLSGETLASQGITVQEDARYPAIWISYKSEVTGKAYRYYRSDYLCSDVRAIAELGTGM